MRSALLWGLIPDQALPLLIVGGGLLCMVMGRRALGFIGPLLLSLLLAPFVESLVAQVPWWIVVLVGIALGLAILRGLLALFIGERATGHLVGALATDVVRWGLVAAFSIPLLVGRGLLGLVRSAQDKGVER